MKKKFLVLILTLALLLTACGKKAPTWQEQYDLGIRYLSEGNYREAILAFTAAISIDPKQEQVYLALSEAYTAAGDTEKAAETLRQAIAEVGGTEQLTVLLESLTAAAPPETDEGTGSPADALPDPEQTPPGVARTEYRDFSDGNRLTMEYDANGNTLRYIYQRPNGTVYQYAVFEYANGSLIRETWYNGDKSVQRWTVFEYPAAGGGIETEYYPDGTVHSVYEYNAAGWDVRSTYYNPDGSMDYSAVAIWDEQNARNKGNTIYNPDGSVDYYYIWDYDAGGNIIRTTYYNPDGTVSHVTN
jgi:antitoxin component YwqK of YwqJK toxin-antitoxin module